MLYEIEAGSLRLWTGNVRHVIFWRDSRKLVFCFTWSTRQYICRWVKRTGPPTCYTTTYVTSLSPVRFYAWLTRISIQTWLLIQQVMYDSLLMSNTLLGVRYCWLSTSWRAILRLQLFCIALKDESLANTK